jgi:hypothetical protein
LRTVRLTQLDGKLPNLALMRLSAFHKAQGDVVHFSRSAQRGLFEPPYDVVYGSAIFDFTAKKVARFQREFPGAIIGGTWNHKPGEEWQGPDVEDVAGHFRCLDYEHWPEFTASLGFSSRGCRFKCGFCGVPKKEGKPRPVATIADLWRGGEWPKHLHLLDNDFFGQPKAAWKARLAEIRDGDFRVCFNQGINVRVITDEIAEEIASVKYRDDAFARRRLYTAWDSLGDERLFFSGVEKLERAGIPPQFLMVFMLVGFDPAETWRDIFYRFSRMVALGIKPYPMIFEDKAAGLTRERRVPLGGHNEPIAHQRLKDFQRWVLTGIYRNGRPFALYRSGARAPGKAALAQADLFGEAA